MRRRSDVCAPSLCRKELLLEGGPLGHGRLLLRKRRFSCESFLHSLESCLSLNLFFGAKASSVYTPLDGTLLSEKTLPLGLRTPVQRHYCLLLNICQAQFWPREQRISFSAPQVKTRNLPVGWEVLQIKFILLGI